MVGGFLTCVYSGKLLHVKCAHPETGMSSPPLHAHGRRRGRENRQSKQRNICSLGYAKLSDRIPHHPSNRGCSRGNQRAIWPSKRCASSPNASELHLSSARGAYFCSQCETDFSYFVQENSCHVGHFESPKPLPHRSWNAPFSCPNSSLFESRRRNMPAQFELDERLRGAAATNHDGHVQSGSSSSFPSLINQHFSKAVGRLTRVPTNRRGVTLALRRCTVCFRYLATYNRMIRDTRCGLHLPQESFSFASGECGLESHTKKPQHKLIDAGKTRNHRRREQ